MSRQADAAAIETAAAILDGEALSLRMSHTLAPDHTRWDDDAEDVRVQFEQWRALVERLYAIAERMRGPT